MVGTKQESSNNINQLEADIKDNMQNIEAKMRETQNKMKMLERERAVMQKQSSSKACSIF